MNTSIIKSQYILSAVIALFSVIFLWWFFWSWVDALWINIAIFGVLFFGLFLVGIKDKVLFLKENLFWVVPFFVIIFSYSLYEIPLLKSINIFLLPIITLFFFGYAKLKKSSGIEWSFMLIKTIFNRKVFLEKNAQTLINNIHAWDDQKKILLKKIFRGIGIFLAINIFIIWLLISADSNFWAFMWNSWNIVSVWNILKIFIALFLFILFVSFAELWRRPSDTYMSDSKKNMDSVIWWIVLWGTLCIYILFIAVQIDSLFYIDVATIIEVPQGVAKVQEIAGLAKSVFWQLFLISIINIVFFFVYYKKTTPLVQKILCAFIFASVIILFSAALRMYNYTSVYGLSYEKFFASYTIVYFAMLFLIMIWYIVSNKRRDILKASIMIALWMYAGLHVIPSEVLIFKVNAHILQQEDSKIQKYQSHMLSIDILQSVLKLEWKDIYTEESWQEWIDKKIAQSTKKYWYEKNIQDFRVGK